MAESAFLVSQLQTIGNMCFVSVYLSLSRRVMRSSPLLPYPLMKLAATFLIS